MPANTVYYTEEGTKDLIAGLTIHLATVVLNLAKMSVIIMPSTGNDGNYFFL